MTDRYRWNRAWCIMGNPGDFMAGDMVEVERQDGTYDTKQVEYVQTFTTKAGRTKIRGIIASENE